MRYETRNFARGTYLNQLKPWGLYSGGRAMCSDGVVRTLAGIASTPDTFFSMPAKVKVKGKTVSGYVTMETEAGFSTDTENDPAIVKFVAVRSGKNAGMLPAGAWKRPADSNIQGE
jgi:hypothetical protein